MAKHWVALADDHMVGVSCSNNPVAGDWWPLWVGDEVPCPSCGEMLRVYWDVHLESVAEATDDVYQAARAREEEADRLANSPRDYLERVEFHGGE